MDDVYSAPLKSITVYSKDKSALNGVYCGLLLFRLVECSVCEELYASWCSSVRGRGRCPEDVTRGLKATRGVFLAEFVGSLLEAGRVQEPDLSVVLGPGKVSVECFLCFFQAMAGVALCTSVDYFMIILHSRTTRQYFKSACSFSVGVARTMYPLCAPVHDPLRPLPLLGLYARDLQEMGTILPWFSLLD